MAASLTYADGKLRPRLGQTSSPLCNMPMMLHLLLIQRLASSEFWMLKSIPLQDAFWSSVLRKWRYYVNQASKTEQATATVSCMELKASMCGSFHIPRQCDVRYMSPRRRNQSQSSPGVHCLWAITEAHLHQQRFDHCHQSSHIQFCLHLCPAVWM